MLKFPDGSQVRVNGLTEILAGLRSEGRQADRETAGAILERLEANKNFIPSSGRARTEYTRVLLAEYKQYLSEHADAAIGA